MFYPRTCGGTCRQNVTTTHEVPSRLHRASVGPRGAGSQRTGLQPDGVPAGTKENDAGLGRLSGPARSPSRSRRSWRKPWRSGLTTAASHDGIQREVRDRPGVALGCRRNVGKPPVLQTVYSYSACPNKQVPGYLDRLFSRYCSFSLMVTQNP